MRIALVIAVIIGVCVPRMAVAFDWVSVHNAAEVMPEAQAHDALSHNPGSVEDLYALGLVYLREHKDAAAREIFEKMPVSVESRWGIAEVLRRQHQRQESIRMLDALISEDPSFMPAYLSRGFLYYLDLRFNDAIRYAQIVIRQGKNKTDTGNFVRAYALYAGAKGMIAHYGGPLSKAINGTVVLSTLRKAEKIKPDASEVLFGIGSFYILAPGIAGGDLKEGIVYLQRAIAQDPLFADAYVRLAQAYLFQGDKQQYTSNLSRAFALDPQNELALDVRDKTCKYICSRD